MLNDGIMLQNFCSFFMNSKKNFMRNVKKASTFSLSLITFMMLFLGSEGLL